MKKYNFIALLLFISTAAHSANTCNTDSWKLEKTSSSDLEISAYRCDKSPYLNHKKYRCADLTFEFEGSEQGATVVLNSQGEVVNVSSIGRLSFAKAAPKDFTRIWAPELSQKTDCSGMVDVFLRLSGKERENLDSEAYKDFLQSKNYEVPTAYALLLEQDLVYEQRISTGQGRGSRPRPENMEEMIARSKEAKEISPTLSSTPVNRTSTPYPYKALQFCINLLKNTEALNSRQPTSFGGNLQRTSNGRVVRTAGSMFDIPVHETVRNNFKENDYALLAKLLNKSQVKVPRALGNSDLSQGKPVEDLFYAESGTEVASGEFGSLVHKFSTEVDKLRNFLGCKRDPVFQLVSNEEYVASRSKTDTVSSDDVKEPKGSHLKAEPVDQE